MRHALPRNLLTLAEHLLLKFSVQGPSHAEKTAKVKIPKLAETRIRLHSPLAHERSIEHVCDPFNRLHRLNDLRSKRLSRPPELNFVLEFTQKAGMFIGSLLVRSSVGKTSDRCHAGVASPVFVGTMPTKVVRGSIARFLRHAEKTAYQLAVDSSHRSRAERLAGITIAVPPKTFEVAAVAIVIVWLASF